MSSECQILLGFIAFGFFLHVGAYFLAPRLSVIKVDIRYRLERLRVARRRSMTEQKLSILEWFLLAISWFVFYVFDPIHTIFLWSFRYKPSDRILDLRRRYLFAMVVDIYNVISVLAIVLVFIFSSWNEWVTGYFCLRSIHIVATNFMMVIEIGLKKFKDYSYGFTRNIGYLILNILMLASLFAYLFLTCNPKGYTRFDTLLMSVRQLLTFTGIEDFAVDESVRALYLVSSFTLLVLVVTNVAGFRRRHDK